MANDSLHVGVDASVGPFSIGSVVGRLVVTGAVAELGFARRTLAAWPAAPAAGDRFVWYSPDGSARLWTEQRGDLLTVHTDGKVGIGTQSPHAQLHLAGGQWDLTNTEGDLKIGTDALRLKLGVALAGAGAGDVRIRAVGGTNRLMIGSGSDDTLTIANGNVGIGTITPGSKLQVIGDVSVSGDILLTGADCAEYFDVAGAQPPEPGTVVVIDQGGGLRESRDAYDKKVAGVISGAGEYTHALLLDRRPSDEARVPVALVGKVYCKVDADCSPIQVGDLLTTSPTPGHAMKAVEPLKAFGAVIGKALSPLKEGQRLIPILINLQ
jgi:hypothetical protein